MPGNVRRFVWLWWSSIVIALIAIPLLPPPSSKELELGVTRPILMAISAGVAVTLVAVALPFFGLPCGEERIGHAGYYWWRSWRQFLFVLWMFLA
jgi:hypothetical protein